MDTKSKDIYLRVWTLMVNGLSWSMETGKSGRIMSFTW
jgi:hypothetical protein